jgi:hypothetical protein
VSLLEHGAENFGNHLELCQQQVLKRLHACYKSQSSANSSRCYLNCTTQNQSCTTGCAGYHLTRERSAPSARMLPSVIGGREGAWATSITSWGQFAHSNVAAALPDPY